jgi:AraC-like DNA-binding protein
MIFNYDSLTFEILTVEKIKHRDGKFTVKERPYAALSVRLGGQSSFIIDDNQFTAKIGDVVFIPSGKTYEVEYRDSEFIVVHLLGCNYYEAELIARDKFEEIVSLFSKMLEHWKKQRSINKASSYLYEILYTLEKDQNHYFVKRPIDFERCLSYLSENFCDANLKIETLCDFGYVSRSSLQRYFLRYLGVPPKQYLLQLRLNKAIDLLANESKTISEIAVSCGFSDEKYFSRIFKQQYGISPSDARHRTHI